MKGEGNSPNTVRKKVKTTEALHPLNHGKEEKKKFVFLPDGGGGGETKVLDCLYT